MCRVPDRYIWNIDSERRYPYLVVCGEYWYYRINRESCFGKNNGITLHTTAD